MPMPVDRNAYLLVLSSIAASYTRRELDRRVYDRVMDSQAGHKLKNLTVQQKYALEFVTYAASAIAMTRLPSSGPLGQYLRDVLTDIPSEIARRMINGAHAHKFSTTDITSVVGLLTNEDLDQFASAGELRAPNDESTPYGKSSRDDSSAAGSVGESVRNATLSIEAIRKRLREKRQNK